MSEAVKVGRLYDRQKVVIANGASISSGGRMGGLIDASQYAGGVIVVPSAWTAADITFEAVTQPGLLGVSPVQGNPPGNETPVPVRLITGTARAKISGILTSEAGCYPIPPEAMQAGYFFLRSTNTESEASVTQGGSRTLWVVLKG